MNIHEYQAKSLLGLYQIPTGEGEIAFEMADIKNAIEKLNTWPVVLKAQVHAGGRGKAGGIKVAKDMDSALQEAEQLFGKILITPQTGAEGKIVRRILVTPAVNIDKEYYAGIVLDRTRNQLVFMASKEGGVEIEKVAAETPELIVREYIDNALGLRPYQARRLALALGLEGKLARPAASLFMNLYKAFKELDCSLLEINPLITTKEGELMALDVKLNIDDNALYRHQNIADMRDFAEENPLEVEASKSSLNYIKLDGNVGCMVNGAGLAMATMDIIKNAGAEPANFLDVGGGASEETVENGLRIILSDENVKAILVNIFGGIVRCDRVANGIVNAAKKIGVGIPLVVRLAGTNADIASDILSQSGLDIIPANELSDASVKVVNALK